MFRALTTTDHSTKRRDCIEMDFNQVAKLIRRHNKDREGKGQGPWFPSRLGGAFVTASDPMQRSAGTRRNASKGEERRTLPAALFYMADCISFPCATGHAVPDSVRPSAHERDDFLAAARALSRRPADRIPRSRAAQLGCP